MHSRAHRCQQGISARFFFARATEHRQLSLWRACNSPVRPTNPHVGPGRMGHARAKLSEHRRTFLFQVCSANASVQHIYLCQETP